MYKIYLEIKDGYKNFKNESLFNVKDEMAEFIINTKTYSNNDYVIFKFYINEKIVYKMEGKIEEMLSSIELLFDIVSRIKENGI